MSVRKARKRAAATATSARRRSASTASQSTASLSSRGTANGSRSTALDQLPVAGGSGASGVASGACGCVHGERERPLQSRLAGRARAAAGGAEAPRPTDPHPDPDPLARVGPDLDRLVANGHALALGADPANVRVVGPAGRAVHQIRQQLAHG